MKYSTEYVGVITMFLVPLLQQWLSEGSANEVAGLIASLVVSGVAGLYVLFKRWQRGQEGSADKVTALGFKK